MSGVVGAKWGLEKGMSPNDIRKKFPFEEDTVSHPSHYISATGLESIDVIKAFTFELQGYDAYATGNILKYIMRWSHKNGIEDLKKARWYLNDLIDHLENGDLDDE